MNKEAKPKRLKKVFSSSMEVFHLWANQSQSEARQGGRMTRAFFRDSSCWSYGHHYEVGRLVKIKGHTVALINRDGYSHTTGKHINEASSAASHLFRITVDGTFDWKQGLINMQGKLIDTIFDMFTGRSFYAGYCVWDTYRRKEFAAFNALCDAVGMGHLKINTDDASFDLTLDLAEAHVQSRIRRQKELDARRLTPEYLAKKEAERARNEEKAEAKRLAEIEAWKQGGEFTQAVKDLYPALIRIKGEHVQTSRHATVSLAEAKQALRAVLKGTIKEGDSIGSYKFTDQEGDVVRVGCHDLSLNQAKAVLLNGGFAVNPFKLIHGGNQ